MSVVADVEYQLSQMKREAGETDKDFAIRLFGRQMEVYSANAGRDLWDGTPEEEFARFSAEARASWIERAKKQS